MLPVIADLGEVMILSSICGLGRSVPVPLQTVIEFFSEDLLALSRRAVLSGRQRLTHRRAQRMSP